MRRPAFQFYPADWRNNANLRRCSPAARGVWMDVLCVLHDSDEYGLVRWPLADLAQAANTTVKVLGELVDKQVLKGGNASITEPFIYTPRTGRKDGEPVTLVPTQAGPVWYSSRMVKDEYIRTIRGEQSRFESAESAPDHSPKTTPKASPKPPFGDGSSTSSSPSVKDSVANATAARPPSEMTKVELWEAGKSLLEQGGVPSAQCGSFVGKLVTSYGDEVVVAAVRSAVVAMPADPREYLKATCQRLKGERVSPITVPSNPAQLYVPEKPQTPEEKERADAARRVVVAAFKKVAA